MAASSILVFTQLLVPRAVWVTLIVAILFSFLPTPLQPFLLSFFNRGKHIPRSSSPPRFTIPHRLFLHFYIVGTIFNGILLLLVIAHIYLRRLSNFVINIGDAWRVVTILFLFELQVSRRVYESIYVSKFSQHARMHIFAYVLGLTFYIVAPLSLFPRAMELIVGGFSKDQHGDENFESNIQGKNPLLLLGLQYWVGAAIFMWGWVHQYRCHSILALLRADNPMKKEDDHYKIPYGDWFEYVSCAHYLAEFVIYFGLLVATGGLNMDTWLLFLFVVLNLSVAAANTHEWYKKKFPDYPARRKAVIPYIY